MAMVNNPDRIFMSKAKAFNEALSILPGSIGPSSSSSLKNAADVFYARLGATAEQVGSSLKELITEAFKNANADLRNSGMRLNKGELYAILFTHGLPMGVIAKILLNGNLGPIRNAIILHKQGVASIFEVKTFDGAHIEFLDEYSGVKTWGSRNARTLMSIDENSQEAPLVRVSQKFALVCHAVGGERLLEKLLSSSDQIAFCNSYRNEDGSVAFGFISTFVEPLNFCAYNSRLGTRLVRNKMISYGQNLLSNVPGRRRGVRRTGLTTSRAVQRVNAGQELPSTQSVRESGSTVTPAAVSSQANVVQPSARERQVLVKDIPFTNTLGVEIEIVADKPNTNVSLINDLNRNFAEAGLNMRSVQYTHETTPYWKIVPDGSVYPNGCEVVSPVLKGKRGLTDLKKAIRAIRVSGGSVNSTVGVHVHFGAQGMELQQFKNLLLNYAGFEPIINKFLYVSRRNSQWASLISRIPNYKEKIESASSFYDLKRKLFGEGATSQNYRSSGRYHSVNLYAFLRHGTIEFRQLQGSVEEDTIIYWVMFLHFLFEASKRKTLSYFDDKQLRNITPRWLSTWLGNRAFDMSGDNFNSYNR
jgi:hypothetical protein